MRFGKKPARPDAVKLKYRTYFNVVTLAPIVFGQAALKLSFGMLANDSVGDCVWAGAAHETMLWEARAGAAPAPFTNQAVLSDYSAVTGYDPSDPNSDQGTDVSVAAAYRKATGIVDGGGTRHKVDSYVALKAGDLAAVAQAAYLFGAIGVGIEVPSSAMDQFKANQPWSVVHGSPTEGGHYIPIVGRNSAGNFLCVTWGRVHAMTPSFLAKYMDEGVCYLSLEYLANNLSPLQVDLDALRADEAALDGGNA